MFGIQSSHELLPPPNNLGQVEAVAAVGGAGVQQQCLGLATTLNIQIRKFHVLCTFPVKKFN